jgi:predicted nucleic acid-binding protein
MLTASFLGVKTPDALHVATALVHRCNLFVTNDKDLRKIAELNITVLSELVGTTEPFCLVFVEPAP